MPYVESWHFYDQDHVVLQWVNTSNAPDFWFQAQILNHDNDPAGTIYNSSFHLLCNAGENTDTLQLQFSNGIDTMSAADGSRYLLFCHLRTLCNPTDSSADYKFSMGYASLENTFGPQCGIELPHDPILIPDNGSTEVADSVTIPEAQDEVISSLGVSFEITHTYAADISVRIVSPQGTSVDLVQSGNPMGSNFNLSLYLLDGLPDQGSVTDNNGNNHGFCAPAGSLSLLQGEHSAGTWHIFVQDHAAADIGYLLKWCVHVNEDFCLYQFHGYLFQDSNNSEAYENGERTFPFLVFRNLTENVWQISDSSGFFRHCGQSATNELSIPEVPRHFTFFPNPANVQCNFSINDTSLQNISLTPFENVKDGELSLSPAGVQSANSNVFYRVQARNIGTQCIPASQITLETDPNLTSASIQGASSSSSGNTFTIEVPQLCPNEQIDFLLEGHTGNTADVINLTGNWQVMGEADTSDNSVHAHFPLETSDNSVNFFVDKTTLISPFYANHPTRLNYHVAFSNISSTAVNSLDFALPVPSAFLKMASFRLINSSHPLNMEVRGDTLFFHFNNLNLPSVAQDNSSGRISLEFSLRPQNNLEPGDTIPTELWVYPDNFSPTNYEAPTAIESALGLMSHSGETLGIYPNPASDQVIIKNPVLREDATLSIYDLAGRKIVSKEIHASEIRIELNNWKAGYYLVHLQNANGQYTGAFIKR